MLYLTCTMIFSVDLAHYGVSCVKDWVSGERCRGRERGAVVEWLEQLGYGAESRRIA